MAAQQLDPEKAFEENGARPASTWLGHRGNAAFDLRSKFIAGHTDVLYRS
jgi:hypothetical protein